MKKTIWKSIGAVAGGFIGGSILTVAADFTMQSAHLLDMQRFRESPAWVVLIVAAYRFVFSIAGCYITAWLAPANPMKHAIILGSIGLFLSLLGAFFMWDEAASWYNLAVIFMALPCAYLGGKIYQSNVQRYE